MLKVVVGHSDDPDSQSAIADVLKQCCADLGEVKPNAGILFAAIDFEHQLIVEEINRVFPGLDLIGCTTDGEVSSVLGFQQDSLTLMLFAVDGDRIQIGVGVGLGVKDNPLLAAEKAVSIATQKLDKPVKLCIPLPASYIADGSTTSGEDILRGLKAVLGENLPIVGGTAGDQFRFQKTYQFYRTDVLTDALPILLLAGDVHCSFGVDCGWQPIGNRSVVTKSQGNIVYEIDGKPAIEFYHKYLGDRAPNAEHPLAVYIEDSDRYYMRVPNKTDLEIGSIHFLAEVPQQSMIRMTSISRDEVIGAAKTAWQIAFNDYPGKEPQAVLIFSCCCRRWLLGTRTQEEYQLIQSSFREKVPTCGFYTYGEFAPLALAGESYFHQETFVTLLIGTK